MCCRSKPACSNALIAAWAFFASAMGPTTRLVGYRMKSLPSGVVASMVPSPSPDSSHQGRLALPAECEQVAVHEISMRGGEAVRQTRIVDFFGPLDQLC